MAGRPQPGTVSAPPQRKGLTFLRAFGVRFLVGGGLAVVVAATLIWLRWGFIVLLAAFVALGAHELGHAASLKGWRPVWQVVAVGGPVVILAEYAFTWFAPTALAPLPIGFVGCAALVVAAWGWRLRRSPDGFLADAGVTVLIVAYLPLLATFAIAMVRSAHPVAQVATFIACIVANDSGAYIMGSWLGRHKMTPHISPAKTWEGFAGGIVWAAVAGALLVRFALHASWWQGVVFGVVLGLAATLGDLVESAIKRDVGLKDMGKLLPGHGGIMDRLDSLLYCAPVAWALLNLWISR